MTEAILYIIHQFRMVELHQSRHIFRNIVNELIVVRIGMAVAKFKFEVDWLLFSSSLVSKPSRSSVWAATASRTRSFSRDTSSSFPIQTDADRSPSLLCDARLRSLSRSTPDDPAFSGSLPVRSRDEKLRSVFIVVDDLFVRQDVHLALLHDGDCSIRLHYIRIETGTAFKISWLFGWFSGRLTDQKPQEGSSARDRI